MKTIEIQIPDGYRFDKETMSVVKNEETNTYVDLGLPSGTLWSDKNVGAECPTDYGDYLTFEKAKDVAPTQEQLEELVENTNHIWCKMDDVQGYLFVSIFNGNYIFLPAAGYHARSGLYNKYTDSNYWSSSLCGNDSGSACYYCFSSVSVGWGYGRHFFGFPVRQCKSKN